MGRGIGRNLHLATYERIKTRPRGVSGRPGTSRRSMPANILAMHTRSQWPSRILSRDPFGMGLRGLEGCMEERDGDGV